MEILWRVPKSVSSLGRRIQADGGRLTTLFDAVLQLVNCSNELFNVRGVLPDAPSVKVRNYVQAHAGGTPNPVGCQCRKHFSII
jgi:hypothetical protein